MAIYSDHNCELIMGVGKFGNLTTQPMRQIWQNLKQSLETEADTKLTLTQYMNQSWQSKTPPDIHI